MDGLCGYAYDACRQHIRLDTIDQWLDFIEPAPSPDGSATPVSSPSIFGHYAQRLREDVLQFLVVTLPAALDINRQPPSQDQPSEPNGRDILLQVFSRIPFDFFKAAIESPTFQIGQRPYSLNTDLC
jgi:hypothetical protein